MEIHSFSRQPICIWYNKDRAMAAECSTEIDMSEKKNGIW